jgi:transposase
MPGVGPGTTIELLRTVGDGSTFASAAHVASYAGLAPATRQSGRSIKGEQQARRGNRSLRGALYFSAFASLKHPASRTYYDRKRAKGKSHTAALTCLARRRVDVLYAMLRDRQHYRAEALDPSPTPTSQPPIGSLLLSRGGFEGSGGRGLPCRCRRG